MKHLFAPGCGLALSLILGACSALVPPQVIDNPIGLSGRRVQVEIGATSAPGTAADLATAAAGLGIIEAGFDDFDTSSVPVSLDLSQSLFKLGLADDATLASSASSLPCNLFLTRVDVVITVSDALQSYTLPAFELNKVTELEQQPDDLNRYRLLTRDVFVGNVLSAQDADRLQAILTTGGSNRVTAQVIIEATSVPDLPPGSVLTLEFESSEATLTF